MVKVLIADNQPILDVGLRELLKRIPGTTVIETELSDGRELVAVLAKQKADLVIIELCLGGRICLDVVQEMKRLRPKTRVVAFVARDQQDLARRALKAGVDALLSKDDPADEFVRAVQKVAGGGKYLTSALQDRFLAPLSSDPPKPAHEILSNREYEIMLRLADGDGIKAIAIKLSLSPKTVTTYRSRILNKMHLNTNADLTRYQQNRPRASSS